MDELLRQLKRNGVGCWLMGMFLGAIAYADDLTLLCPSSRGLQQMITVCEQYGHEFGMSYNASKSMCVLFSRRKKPPPLLYLNGNILSWVDTVKHLGNFISYDLSEDVELKMKKCDLIGRVNCVIGTMNRASVETIMTVFNSKCCHFYGSQAWTYNGLTLQEFARTWNRCVRRLLHLPNTTHCRYLPHLANTCAPLDRICKMFLKMFGKMCKSENNIIRRLAIHAMENCGSITGINRAYVQRMYGVTVNVDTPVSIRLCSCTCSTEDFCIVQAIRELKSLCALSVK